MKNLVNIALISCLILVLSGCDADNRKANFEDKDLTKVFIKNNKDKLNKIYSIDTFWQYEFGRKGGDLVTNVYLSFTSLTPYFEYGFYDCNSVIHIDSDSVKFTRDDIILNGKETMYKEAQKCLDAVIKEIKETEKKVIEYKEQEKKENDKLNKKFNENEIK